MKEELNQRDDIAFHTIWRHVSLGGSGCFTLAVTCYGDLVFVSEVDCSHAACVQIEGKVKEVDQSILNYIETNYIGVSHSVAVLRHGVVSLDMQQWFKVQLPLFIRLAVIPVINQTKSGFAPHRFAFNLRLANDALARYKGKVLKQRHDRLQEAQQEYRIARDNIRLNFDGTVQKLKRFLEIEPASNSGFTAEMNLLVCKLELNNLCDELASIEECQASRLAATTDEIKKLLMHLEELQL